MKKFCPLAGLSVLLLLSSCGQTSGGTGLTGTNTPYGVELAWTFQNNDDPATGFEVFRDNEDIRTVNSTSFLDTNSGSGTHAYFVESVDKDGVTSELSNTVFITVP